MATINWSSATFTTTSAYLDGGLMYLCGTDATMTINNMNVGQSTSTTQKGGTFHFLNTGTTNVVMNTVTVTNSYAYIDGGFFYKTGGQQYNL